MRTGRRAVPAGALPLAALLALGLLSGASAETAQQPATPQAEQPSARPSEPVLEAAALEVLKAASSTLAAARTMTFTAVATYESPSRLGPPLAYTVESQVTLQRPDKLRVISPGDGPASEFYYDGKTMMAYAPAENLVAVADAPSTIDAALRAAYDIGAIYFPFTDVIVVDPYADMADGLKLAYSVGQSRVVGGTVTDMVALVSDQVFAQIWIGAEDKLPRRLRAIYRDDPSRLRHDVTFSDWKLDTPVAAGAFASSEAAAAKRIPFARPDPSAPPPAPKPGTG
jgi:hypothetical protein